VRVLLVTQYFWPENFRINDLAERLTARGHQVSVLTGKPNYPSGNVFPEFRASPGDFADYHGARVYRVPMLARGSGSVRLALNYVSFALGALLFGPDRLSGQRFDAILVFQPSPITVGVPAVWLGRLKRAPVMFWVQDLWPETLAAVNAVRSRWILDAIGALARFIYKRCALVLGQSRGMVDKLAAYCDDRTKIRYFPNWAEDAPAPEDVQPAAEISDGNGTFDVLFAGNIGDAQDFPAVLDAMAKLRDRADIRWILVGDGRRSDWVRAEVERRGLSSRVIMPGRFPVERMPSFYARADALLVSLRADPVFSLTVPSKVQSYLMAGIPILGMLDGEGAAIIRDAEAGIACAAGDSAGLANAVIEMASMPPARRTELAENGRQYARSEFGQDILIDRFEGWLAEVARRGAASSERGPTP